MLQSSINFKYIRFIAWGLLGLSSFPYMASASAVSKELFEKRTGIVVWDLGSAPGQMDSQDNLTDPQKPCTIDDTSTSIRAQEILAAREAPPAGRLEATAAEILSRFGLETAKLKINPVLARAGAPVEPVFLLFPEIHLNNGDNLQLLRLHESLARDMFTLTKSLAASGVNLVNTFEGAQGPWPSLFRLTNEDLKDRERATEKLMTRHWLTGAILIGEVYPDKVLTHLHDDNDLTIQYLLTLEAFVLRAGLSSLSNPENNWSQARSDLQTNYPSRSGLVDLAKYKTFFMDLMRKSESEIRRTNTELCEDRSREMARYSRELALKQKAPVVFMSFGALHTHGILQELQRNSASYIVFSPNY